MYNLIRVQCSSIITKHKESGGVVGETIEKKRDNQTKQQSPHWMLIIIIVSYNFRVKS